MAVTVNNINPSRSTVFTIRGNNNDTYQLTADYIYQAKGPCILYQWYTDGYIVAPLYDFTETCYTANREYLTTLTLDNVIAINAGYGGTNRTFVYNGSSFVSWGKFTPSMYQKGGQYYRAISSEADDADQYLLIYDIDPIYFNREIIPSTHNWQAVSSIVGKSAVSLDLSVILDINDGEAVTTSDASKFDLNNDSNVITLVNNVINQNE